MKDNLAERVRETYRLDDARFKDIVNVLYSSVNRAKKASEALEGSEPAVVLDLGKGQFLVRGEYYVADVGKTVLFGYVGRLIDGSIIGKTAPLYLQIFNPPPLGKIPNPDLSCGGFLNPNLVNASTPNPDLAKLLKKYIVDEARKGYDF